MTARILRTSLLLATAFLPITFLIFPADATATCAAEPSKVIEQARKAFDARDPERDRAARVCLVEAVAALAFTGQVFAPKGFVFTKAEREGD